MPKIAVRSDQNPSNEIITIKISLNIDNVDMQRGQNDLVHCEQTSGKCAGGAAGGHVSKQALHDVPAAVNPPNWRPRSTASTRGRVHLPSSEICSHLLIPVLMGPPKTAIRPVLDPSIGGDVVMMQESERVVDVMEIPCDTQPDSLVKEAPIT